MARLGLGVCPAASIRQPAPGAVRQVPPVFCCTYNQVTAACTSDGLQANCCQLATRAAHQPTCTAAAPAAIAAPAICAMLGQLTGEPKVSRLGGSALSGVGAVITRANTPN
jgi:hypothetical protein